MTFNPEVTKILKEFNIDKDKGLLCLLAIYYDLKVKDNIPEEVFKAINLTKIVTIDYDNPVASVRNMITWNIPLFDGQQTEWSWVTEWNKRWNQRMDRKGANADVLKRMKEFFQKYPEYRVDDVNRATDAYFKAQGGSLMYLMNSAKFIFDGQGAMKKSTLLQWCERVRDSKSNSNQVGRVVK